MFYQEVLVENSYKRVVWEKVEKNYSVHTINCAYRCKNWNDSSSIAW